AEALDPVELVGRPPLDHVRPLGGALAARPRRAAAVVIHDLEATARNLVVAAPDRDDALVRRDARVAVPIVGGDALRTAAGRRLPDPSRRPGAPVGVEDETTVGPVDGAVEQAL